MQTKAFSIFQAASELGAPGLEVKAATVRKRGGPSSLKHPPSKGRPRTR
jgi:hypothetical protein